MIQSPKKNVSLYVDPLSLNADIEVLSGNPSQTFNSETNEYEPDRSVYPCLLMPYVATVATSGSAMNGVQKITGVEWYEGAPNASRTNRIVTGADYIIGDTGCPAYSLKVKKNTNPENPIEYYAVFTFTDNRTNSEVCVERSIAFSCTTYDIRNYSLKIDKPTGFTFDPTRSTTSATSKWLITINAQLYSGKELVADSLAAYWWQVLDGGVWREIDPESDFFCETDKVDGKWGKTLNVDARLFSNITIRCIGCVYEGTYPSNPSNEELSANTTIKVEMPKTISVDVVQTKGVKITAGMKTPVAFAVRIFDNNTEILGKDYLFDVRFFFKATNTATEVEVGRGMSCEFTPSSFGITLSNSASIRAEVRLWSEIAALLDTDGESILADSDGSYFFDINYK